MYRLSNWKHSCPGSIWWAIFCLGHCLPNCPGSCWDQQLSRLKWGALSFPVSLPSLWYRLFNRILNFGGCQSKVKQYSLILTLTIWVRNYLVPFIVAFGCVCGALTQNMHCTSSPPHVGSKPYSTFDPFFRGQTPISLFPNFYLLFYPFFSGIKQHADITCAHLNGQYDFSNT